jgi:DNA repair ATPase RecN
MKMKKNAGRMAQSVETANRYINKAEDAMDDAARNLTWAADELIKAQITRAEHRHLRSKFKELAQASKPLDDAIQDLDKVIDEETEVI